MPEENKILKDSSNNSIKDTSNVPAPYQSPIFGSTSVILTYTKANRLITALYMVTDMIDKEEPIRNKLRTLGAGIISDIHSAPSDACSKVSEIMSFLDIAFAINIISEMNCNILRKEFSALNQSIMESTDKVETLNRRINLSEFFNEGGPDDISRKQFIVTEKFESIGQSIGHQSTRIGVQKGSTLMKALSDRASLLSDKVSSHVQDFNSLKNQRRDEIITVIKNYLSGPDSAGLPGATITDIRTRAKGLLASLGEKTFQRELVSMVRDKVLGKSGEKRWSRYFLAK